jgi:hypothetical protein
MEEGGEDDAAINPFADLDETLVARGPLVELDEDDDANFQVGAGAAALSFGRAHVPAQLGPRGGIQSGLPPPQPLSRTPPWALQ